MRTARLLSVRPPEILRPTRAITLLAVLTVRISQRLYAATALDVPTRAAVLMYQRWYLTDETRDRAILTVLTVEAARLNAEDRARWILILRMYDALRETVSLVALRSATVLSVRPPEIERPTAIALESAELSRLI